MSEFAMEGRDHAARQESAFVHGYIEAMFFTEHSSGLTTQDWLDGCEAGTNEGPLPGDVGYADLHPSALNAIRAQCEAFQAKAASLLERAYNVHWQRAAMAEGWTRNFHNGYFVAPIGHDTRLADYESWQELCECEGIEPGSEYDETQAGRDFWFTRNGHGVGYWDRQELEPDSLGQELSALCGFRTEFPETHTWFADHTEHGKAPFVYHA